LENYYKVNYQLLQNHHYSLLEVEDMIPWEREIYLMLLTEDLKKQRDEMERAKLAGR